MAPDDPLVQEVIRQADRLIGGPAAILIGVSGGPDSVALCRAIAAGHERSGWAPRVAHVNHQLRAGADDDERFVAALAAALGLPFDARRVDVPARRRRAESEETAARRCRYEALARLAAMTGAQFVLTGHTADDQAETVLHRVLRGSGLAGLAGIPEWRPLGGAGHRCAVIRPLLGVTRRAVLAYLGRLGQPFRTDATNADPRHTRNRLRRTMPDLAATYNPRLSEALVRLARLAGDAQRVVDERIDRLWADCVRPDDRGRIVIDPGRLLEAPAPELRRLDPGSPARSIGGRPRPRFLLAELIRVVWTAHGWPARDLGAAALDRVVGLLDRPTGRTQLPGGVLAEFADGLLVLSRSGGGPRAAGQGLAAGREMDHEG